MRGTIVCGLAVMLPAIREKVDRFSHRFTKLC